MHEINGIITMMTTPKKKCKVLPTVMILHPNAKHQKKRGFLLECKGLRQRRMIFHPNEKHKTQIERVLDTATGTHIYDLPALKSYFLMTISLMPSPTSNVLTAGVQDLLENSGDEYERERMQGHKKRKEGTCLYWKPEMGELSSSVVRASPVVPNKYFSITR